MTRPQFVFLRWFRRSIRPVPPVTWVRTGPEGGVLGQEGAPGNPGIGAGARAAERFCCHSRESFRRDADGDQGDDPEKAGGMQERLVK